MKISSNNISESYINSFQMTMVMGTSKVFRYDNFRILKTAHFEFWTPEYVSEGGSSVFELEGEVKGVLETRTLMQN